MNQFPDRPPEFDEVELRPDAPAAGTIDAPARRGFTTIKFRGVDKMRAETSQGGSMNQTTNPHFGAKQRAKAERRLRRELASAGRGLDELLKDVPQVTSEQYAAIKNLSK